MKNMLFSIKFKDKDVQIYKIWGLKQRSQMASTWVKWNPGQWDSGHVRNHNLVEGVHPALLSLKTLQGLQIQFRGNLSKRGETVWNCRNMSWSLDLHTCIHINTVIEKCNWQRKFLKIQVFTYMGNLKWIFINLNLPSESNENNIWWYTS